MSAYVESPEITLKKRMSGRKKTRATEKKDDTGQIIRRLVTYMAGGESRRPFVVAMLVRLLAVTALVAIPCFTSEAIHVISSPNATQENLLNWILLALIAGVIFLVLSIIAERVFSRLATRALFLLQNHLFSHMQTLSLTFFDRQPIGQLMSRVTNDTETVALFYETAVAQIIRALFQIVLIAIVMLFLDFRLALISLTIIPIMLFLTGVIQRISTPAFNQLQERLEDLSGFQESTISGNKVINSNLRQEWAEDTNDDLASGVYDLSSKAFFTSLLQFPLTQTLTMVMIAVVLVIGSLMALDDLMQVGTVIAFATYVALLASPQSEIANLTATSLNAVAGGRRVFSIIDEEPTVVDDPDAAEFEFKGGNVAFEDVDFSYVPGRKILRDNTFDAKPGQKIGICGPTGVGKSTIINILTRYYDTESGTILIDGQDLSKLSQVSLRKQIGTVLQEAFLFSDTVMNNLKYAREGATDEEAITAAKEANAHDFIINLPEGYETMLTERGANLSQGQRQMITIARTMVAQPKIMILDEATSNVETRTEKLIQEGLRRLMEGKTSFSIANRLATIRDSAKIMVLNGGEIVEYAPHGELMADKGFYYALYMSQFKGKAPGGAEAADVDFVST